MRITESTIIDKGLDYIRSLDDFDIWGTIECYYPEILDGLKGDYNIKTISYWGSLDGGKTITTFKKKHIHDQEFDRIKKSIELFEKLHRITITEWHMERELDIKPSHL